MVESDAIMTVREVAEHLRVHPNTVRELLAAGIIKGFRTGKHGNWRVSMKALTDFQNKSYERKLLK